MLHYSNKKHYFPSAGGSSSKQDSQVPAFLDPAI